MIMYNEVLEDCYEAQASPIDVFGPEKVRQYLSELSSKPFGKLTPRQISYGDNILNQFLASNDPNYALYGGKSELIMALSLYCSMLPENAGLERHNLICEKLWSERPLLLSETVYNDLENGRAGILLALTYFYLLRADDRIEDILSNLLLMMISDARFYKKSISWFRSDLVPGRNDLYRDNSDVIFALNYVKSVFKNEFLGMLLTSIWIGAQRFPGKNPDNMQQPANIGEAYEILFAHAELYDHKSELLVWLRNLERITSSSIQDIGGLNFKLNGLTKPAGFSILLKNNFFEFVKEISSQVLDDIISELSLLCTDLNQYQILNVLKNISSDKERSKFKILLRRLRLRAEIIDKSEVFGTKTAHNLTFYENCKLFASMPMRDFFDVKLTINQEEICYRLINSNWLYSYKYEKKRFVGCFSVIRYDKSIFINTELLDGFLPKLFLHLSGQSGCINQFKRDVLQNLNLEINDEHFKNRLLLLIRQGILIPTEGNTVITCN